MSKFMFSVKLNQFKDKFNESLPFNNRGWVIILICMISISGLIYLAQINNLATKGYQIKNLDERISELKNKNKQLEVQITDLSSTERIMANIEKLKMVEVVRVEYLQANGTSVAINR